MMYEEIINLIISYLNVNDLLSLRSTCKTMCHFVSLKEIVMSLFDNLDKKIDNVLVFMEHTLEIRSKRACKYRFKLFKLFMSAGIIDPGYYDYYASRSLAKGHIDIVELYIEDGYQFTEGQILGMNMRMGSRVPRMIIKSDYIKINDKICRYLLIGSIKDRSVYTTSDVLKTLIKFGYDFKQDLVNELYEFGFCRESESILHCLMKHDYLPDLGLMQMLMKRSWVIKLVIYKEHVNFFELMLNVGYIPNKEELTLVLRGNREKLKQLIGGYLESELREN